MYSTRTDIHSRSSIKANDGKQHITRVSEVREAKTHMQTGIDSFAAAFDENSRAVNPADRLRQLVEQIEHADEVGLDTFVWANTIAGSFSIRRRP
jgi:hypothetical protein